MALIAWPADLPIESVTWSQEQPRVSQRSEFTGATRHAYYGPTARWSASVQPAALACGQAGPLRGLLARLSMPGNWVKLPFMEAARDDMGPLNFDGLPPAGSFTAPVVGGSSITIARAGDMVTVQQATGDASPRGYQALTLVADVVTNAAGEATMSWAQPLRAAPSASGINYTAPFALMRANSLAWSIGGGQRLAFGSFDMEEAF